MRNKKQIPSTNQDMIATLAPKNIDLLELSSSFATLTKQMSDMWGKYRFPGFESYHKLWNVPDYWNNRWAIDLETMTSSYSLLSKPWHDAYIRDLASLESKTCLMAKDYGFENITSVVSQISAIKGTFFTQNDSFGELIAPSSMLKDLGDIAIKTHKEIVNTGSLSPWKLGIINSASCMVDKYIDWALQLYSSVYEEPQVFDLNYFGPAPETNILSALPLNLEEEKKKDEKISPEKAMENTPSYRITEKGKRLVNKIVDVNKMCERSGRIPIFKYTGSTMVAAATLGGTIARTKETFGSIIDGLYVFFYENLEHIKEVVTEEVVREEAVFQCIFRVKDIRTDYRHDYEHGEESKIKKKNLQIGNSYKHYAGRPVLSSCDEYQTSQEKLYDEFYQMAEYLMERVSAA